MSTLYRRIADHYLTALSEGTLPPGTRFPSVRRLMRDHEVSLSTALQVCRHLEDLGWLQARPRSGYYVQRPLRASLPPAREWPLEPREADYVGIHARLSALLARGEARANRVNLALAVGPPELYPTPALARTAQQLLRRHPELLTRMSRRHGHPALKAALARRALDRGIHAASEEIVVTHGCIEALNLALRAVTQPGDCVAVESPTFYGMLQNLEALGLRALEIPTSPHTGLSVDALEFALQRDAEQGRRLRAVMVMPTVHNPLGCVMPDAAKERLVRLCERHDIALIEDDTYADMLAPGAQARAAKSWCRSGHVIYCQSLNKSLAPGLRVGWTLAGRWQARVEMLKYTQTRFNEDLPQMALAGFVAGAGWDRHLNQLRQTLARRREDYLEGIARHFPAGTRVSPPAGGLLLWIELPEQVSGDALFDAALDAGIKISPGSMFSNARRFDHFMRLTVGTPYSPAVDDALKWLGGRIGAAATR
ncbi:MAG: PLP-dependent aminotransferase family protein [Pelomonas sp.]|nr:PLP-dependent aminotransferase family protein [Roseateles sp.]